MLFLNKVCLLKGDNPTKEIIIILVFLQGCAINRTSRGPMSDSPRKILWSLKVHDDNSGEEMNYTIEDRKFSLRVLDKYFCKFNSSNRMEGIVSKSITCDVAGTEVGTITYCQYGKPGKKHATLFFKNSYDNVRLIFSCLLRN